MIKYVAGDILHAKTQYIAHGVAAGAPEEERAAGGLALRISSRWPDVQKHFKQFTRGQKFQGGDLFTVAPAKNRPGIIFIATQPEAGRDTLPFINRGLRKLSRYCVKHDVRTVSLPKIGGGSGELDWEGDVKPLLEKYFEDEDTTLFVYEDSGGARRES